MHWSSFVAAFVPVFLAELPDKTMVATLVLTGTYRRPLAVWLGVAGAFTFHAILATVAGGLLARLPTRWVALAAMVLFAVGAVVLWRSRNSHESAEAGEAAPLQPFARVFSLAFGTVLVAEFGDLTQLTIAGLAATQPSPITIFLGGMLALWAVAALAVLAGRRLLAHLPLKALHIGAATVFAGLSKALILCVHHEWPSAEC
jgi:Ca2+/H+ antiporter, TMEM165/GDT1 family